MSEWLARVELELEGLQDASSVSTTDLVDPWMRRCIYKVPASVKDLNKKAYEPQLVSFGPYHHGEEHLRPMEEHKQRSLLHFIKRSNKPLTLYFNYLLEVVQDLKDSYDSLDPYWQRDNDRFLQLMILDGCFMLELLRCTTDGPPKDYFKTDPIFSDHGKAHIVPYVKRDMLLLENQLPIMVLHKLVAVEAGKEDEEHVNRLILRFFNAQSERNGKYLHMLDIFRKDLLRVKFSHIRKTQRNRNDRDGKVIGSAMKLYEAGIRFKRSRTASLKDISFSRDGVLSLPFIVVDDTTESTLLNLIAFERLHIGAGTVVTNYVFFMACILKSARDISLLESQQIILNAIGSDTDIVEFFKSLSKEIANDPEDELDQLHRQIIMYLDKPSNKLRAHIVHAYHVSTQWSPWAYWSIIAAILLFTLSVLQTVYTIYPYYHPNK
ncbi:UPF0481 protein [Actinidia chinensis var. chinensis]|uniref:UPF0481 protein n=1 Tax=Actinidia chinensis var. chinensis TaxID=1590841 RepID=A0A2R6RKS9_ACTCC|nr:UPF0481 protein [Actinidia chinensis var. chinensis]